MADTNFSIVLSGGTGTRMGTELPKQYIIVDQFPVIMYSLMTIQNSRWIDSIYIVAAEEWQEFLNEWLGKCKITKFAGFAPAGKSRQHSIRNGLEKIATAGGNRNDIVLIHDAARPNLDEALIERCMNACRDADGALPVIPVKDTIYLSEDREKITSLLNRDLLFAGQAPEAFVFGKYHDINQGLSDDELGRIRGSSEIAYRMGLDIRLVDGDENNYKITTSVDMEKFREQFHSAAGESK